MPEQPENNQDMSIQDLLMAHMIHIDALTQLLLEKGAFTETEFFEKLRKLREEVQRSLADK